MLFLYLACFMLVFMGISWPTTLAAGFLWIAGSVILRLMAKADPALIRIYIRHISYPRHLSARATPWAKRRKIRRWRR